MISFKDDMQGDSDSDSSDSSSVSMETDDSSESDEDIGNNDTNETASNSMDVEPDEEEEEEVVKAILSSKDLRRNHPPAIEVEDNIAEICFHPVNDLIALASVTGDVFLYAYNNEKNELKSTLEYHEKACRDIEFSADGKMLFVVGKDKDVVISDVESENLTGIFKSAHEAVINTITLINENTFVTGDEDGCIKMWDIRRRKNIFTFQNESKDIINKMLTNEEKEFLVCACGDGTLLTLKLPSGKLYVQTEDYSEEFTSLALFKTGRKVVTSSDKGNLYIFNWDEFGLHSDEIPSLTKKSINCMIPITESIAVTGGEDQMLRAQSIFPNRQLGIVGQHDFPVECLDICNSGSIVASYANYDSVKFWNISYFEDLDVKNPVKGGKQKQLKHNLPSSKNPNASDFFADLC